MIEAARVLRDIRDRTTIADALCGAMVALSAALHSQQLEALAIEAQSAIQTNLSDVSSLVENITSLAA